MTEHEQCHAAAIFGMLRSKNVMVQKLDSCPKGFAKKIN